jgi:hypothetical protein
MLRSTPAQTPSRSIDCSRCHRALGLGGDHLTFVSQVNASLRASTAEARPDTCCTDFTEAPAGVSFLTLWSSYRHLGLAHGKAEAWFTDHRITVVRLRLMLDTPSGLASDCLTDAMGGQCTRDCSRARQCRGFEVTAKTKEENAMVRTQPAGSTDAPRSAATSAPLFSGSAGPCDRSGKPF